MSDESLRELERRWKETRSVQDEARFLAERVRSGDLGAGRIRAAAYAGHAAARIALGDQAPGLLGDVRDFVSGLQEYPKEASVAALLALGCLRLSAWRALRPDDGRPQNALDAVAAWLQGANVLPQSLVTSAQAALNAEAGLVSLADRNQIDRSRPGAEDEQSRAAAASFAAYTAALAARAATAPDARRAAGHLLSAVNVETTRGPLESAVVAWALDNSVPGTPEPRR
jgi:hypothetical protein